MDIDGESDRGPVPGEGTSARGRGGQWGDKDSKGKNALGRPLIHLDHNTELASDNYSYDMICYNTVRHKKTWCNMTRCEQQIQFDSK